MQIASIQRVMDVLPVAMCMWSWTRRREWKREVRVSLRGRDAPSMGLFSGSVKWIWDAVGVGSPQA